MIKEKDYFLISKTKSRRILKTKDARLITQFSYLTELTKHSYRLYNYLDIERLIHEYKYCYYNRNFTIEFTSNKNKLPFPYCDIDSSRLLFNELIRFICLSEGFDYISDFDNNMVFGGKIHKYSVKRSIYNMLALVFKDNINKFINFYNDFTNNLIKVNNILDIFKYIHGDNALKVITTLSILNINMEDENFYNEYKKYINASYISMDIEELPEFEFDL